MLGLVWSRIFIIYYFFTETGDGPAVKLVNTPLVDEQNFKELLSIRILLVILFSTHWFVSQKVSQSVNHLVGQLVVGKFLFQLFTHIHSHSVHWSRLLCCYSVIQCQLRNVLTQAQKRHPEFQTLYENTLQKIVISFNKIDVLLHREALLNVIELVQMLQAATSKNKEKEERETKLSRRLSRLSIASVSTAMRKIEPKKGESLTFDR